MFGLLPVKGRFHEISVDGQITDPRTLFGGADIRAASLDTKLKKRDKDLRAPEFFDRTFLGASLGLQCGVSPSRVSLGVAGRSKRSGLSVDVLLDDGQWCASAGDGEVGRRPEVSAHAGADTAAGEFVSHRVGGAAFQALV